MKLRNLKSIMNNSVYKENRFKEEHKNEIRKRITKNKRLSNSVNFWRKPVMFLLSIVTCCLFFLTLIYSIDKDINFSKDSETTGKSDSSYQVIDKGISVSIIESSFDANQTSLKLKINGASFLDIKKPVLVDQNGKNYYPINLNQDGTIVFESIPINIDTVTFKTSLINQTKGNWSIKIPVFHNKSITLKPDLLFEKDGYKLNVKELIFAPSGTTMEIFLDAPFSPLSGKLSNGSETVTMISSSIINPKEDEQNRKLVFEPLNYNDQSPLTLTLEFAENKVWEFQIKLDKIQ